VREGSGDAENAAYRSVTCNITVPAPTGTDVAANVEVVQLSIGGGDAGGALMDVSVANDVPEEAASNIAARIADFIESPSSIR